ncbi:beta-glucosidase [Flaviaesturariibacter flavus]|uniref:Beta-glucosidase n=1 Tax=Flaviaesturariibacter flavus TaxID=2502780 RepID=A0A4R1BPG4_9BACT|nr:glycoside hydrolase family 3 N-terminal domain-containing protein [Flaviaesturariibacter flavus]TCJ19563.1 beta-glucosidase [Flaviaesturariibacter flavus]
MRKRLLLAVPFSLMTMAAMAQKDIYRKGWIDFNKNGTRDVYEDPAQPIDRRVADLLAQMTLEEKTCQLATLYGYGRVLKDELPTPAWKNEIWKDGIANIDEHLSSQKEKTAHSYPFRKHGEAINTVQRWFVEETRLGIPVDFTNEGIHGLTHEKATPLPAPISIGATWNRALVRQAGETVGREARALGYTNIYAPILDAARDQRWGRVVECYGEDPFLIAELGKQMCLGIQSQGVASTLKHFAVYSVPKGGRDGQARTDPHVAPRELHQLYLYPFRRVIWEAKPLGVMSSYNDWDGMPVTGSPYFLTELLRKQYGFNGYVVSDSRAVEFLHEKHHVAADFKDGIRQAVEAGLNVYTNFRMPQVFIEPLRELVREGRLSMARLDERVGEVLRVKFQLGLFDRPYVADPKEADRTVHGAAGDSLEARLNRESLVLLKNADGLLPLDKARYRRILVTGPLANDASYSVSRYGPNNNPIIPVLEGVRSVAGSGTSVTYEMGCTVTNAGWPETEIIPTPLSQGEQDSIARAVAAGKDADLIIAVLGEDERTVGESLSRTSLDLPGRQQQLLEALYATGKPVVLVLVNGQPLTINWANRFVPAILQAGFTGPSGGRAVAEALFGDYNPGGKLTMTWPKTVGQIELNFPYKPGSHAGQSVSADPNGYGKTHVNGPLYPFAYGLSYTTFGYSNLKVRQIAPGSESDIEVFVDVANTGKRAGDEVVQLYLKDLVSSVTTYELQLRGFERVRLQPGETKQVRFVLHPDDLALLDKDMNWRVEPGTFEVQVGSSSVDIRQKQRFEIR